MKVGSKCFIFENERIYFDEISKIDSIGVVMRSGRCAFIDDLIPVNCATSEKYKKLMKLNKETLDVVNYFRNYRLLRK